MARLPLSTMADWNYVGGGSVGHAEVLDGTWKSPEAQPPSARGASFRRRTAEAHRHARDADAAWTRCEAQVVAQDVGTT